MFIQPITRKAGMKLQGNFFVSQLIGNKLMKHRSSIYNKLTEEVVMKTWAYLFSMIGKVGKVLDFQITLDNFLNLALEKLLKRLKSPTKLTNSEQFRKKNQFELRLSEKPNI